MKKLFNIPAIIGALPATLTNGTTADATQVMADLNWIVNQVNANAAPLLNTALLNANNNFSVVQSGIAASAAANFPIASQVQNYAFNTLTSALGTNTITARIAALALGAYVSGQVFTFIPPQTNSGSATLNIDGLGSGVIQRNGAQLIGAELKAGVAAMVEVTATTPVFQLIGPTQPGRVFISSASASNSATIDFAGNINATYDEYEIVVTNLAPATDATLLHLRFSEDGGATFKAGGTDYAHTRCVTTDNNAPSQGGGSTGDSKIVLAGAVANNKPMSGTIKVFSPSGSSFGKNVDFELSYAPSGLAVGKVSGAGFFQLDLNPINGFRFLMSSGNITSGTFALYGIRKS